MSLTSAHRGAVVQVSEPMDCLQAPPAWEQSAARRATQRYAAHEDTQMLSVDHEGEGVPRSERAWSLEEPDEEGGQGPSRATAWRPHAADEHTDAERQGTAMLTMLSAAQPSRDCSRPSTGSARAGQDISRQGSLGAPSVADLLGVLSLGSRMPSNGDPEHAQNWQQTEQRFITGCRPSRTGGLGHSQLSGGSIAQMCWACLAVGTSWMRCIFQQVCQ